jgi:hypothetical protein
VAKLTKRTIDGLKPRGKLYAVFDGQVPCRLASRRSSWNTGHMAAAAA